MLSAFICSERSYPAMLLAEQPVHQRFVRPGPLVLGSTLLKSPTPTADRDRTVLRRSEPRSRTALMGEQPNPWDQLRPQDATIRHRALSIVTDGADYIFTLPERRSGEGPAYDSGRKFGRSNQPVTRYLIVSLSKTIQSLRGHHGSASARLPTVLSSALSCAGRSSPL
jgi:hypothetical protein